MMIVMAASAGGRKMSVMNKRTTTADESDNQHESTYSLLARSEEKSRNVFEIAIYPLLILGPLFALWQFARQPITIPADGLRGAGAIACVSEFHYSA
jgi:hypothetical protein